MAIKAHGDFSLREADEIFIQTFDGIKNPLTTES